MPDDKSGEYYPCVSVAAVDILAMKTLLNKPDKCESAMKALELLVKNASVNDFYPDEHFKVKAGSMYEFGDYFADSVYFFGDTKQDMSNQVDLLCVKCASLIAGGIAFGFLIRAGIAVGDLRIKKIQLSNGNYHEIRIGTSMARAHILQESQEWIGGAVESEFQHMPNDINRVPYDVPINKEKATKSGIILSSQLEAVNWVYILPNFRPLHNSFTGLTFDTKEKVIEKVRNSVKEHGSPDCEEIQVKLNNTIAFIDYVFSQSKYLPQ